MADLLNRTTNTLLRSVNTPDYVPGWKKGDPAPAGGEWIVNPNLAAVDGIPSKYWRLTGNTVAAMTQQERDAVDLAAKKAQAGAQASRLSETTTETAGLAVLLSYVNEIRGAPALHLLTKAPETFAADVKATLEAK